VQVGETSGMLDFGLSASRFTKRYVVADGVVEQNGILRNDRNRLAYRRQRQVANRLSVKQNAACIGVDQPDQKPDDSRLTAPLPPTTPSVFPAGSAKFTFFRMTRSERVGNADSFEIEPARTADIDAAAADVAAIPRTIARCKWLWFLPKNLEHFPRKAMPCDRLCIA